MTSRRRNLPGTSGAGRPPAGRPLGRTGPAGPRLRVGVVGLAFALVAALSSGATFVVTNTNDTGAGSLRQAILDANANSGADTIQFAVSGAGCSNEVCTIAPQSALPSVTSPVTIDGYTQTGATANTNASGAINAVLKIVVSGLSAGSDVGLFFATGSDGSTVKGLAINAFDFVITIYASDVAVQGCFLGTDASGMTVVGGNPNNLDAFGGFGGSALGVGGSLPADRNLISGSVILDSFAGATIQGNLIGTNATGAAVFPGARLGMISILHVGGTTVIKGNVVAGSDAGAINIGDGSPSTFATILQGNFIGTDATGTIDLGNRQVGIGVDTTDVTVGGTGPGEGNVIAYNTEGIYVYTSANRCTIRGNSIHSNDRECPAFYGCWGVRLENLSPPLSYISPMPNDPGDADTGANDRQNFPIITSAVAGGGNTTITGSLNSTPNTLFTLDFYSNPSCLGRPQAYYEGKTYLGSGQVTTDGNGDAPINVVLPVSLDPNDRVVATATDPDGNTSEFSQRIVLHSSPGGGDPLGVPGVQLSGFHFLPGATVTVGGIAAPSVVVNDYDTATITTPSLPPGTVNNVTLTNTDGSTGTLPNGFIADFVDVPEGGGPFWEYVRILVRNQITVGLGGGMYGVDQATKRQQMAVFLLKSKHGICYTPPPCTTPAFGDVPCSSVFAPWINQLVVEGITGGCGGGSFCPDNPVNRQQMAVFLLKGLEGGGYAPPACTTATFTDVPCSSPFATWIYELVRRGITAGCGDGTIYCPGNPTTRGQMAVFLTFTFGFF
jgi:parallel beta-helix repeat protein